MAPLSCQVFAWPFSILPKMTAPLEQFKTSARIETNCFPL